MCMQLYKEEKKEKGKKLGSYILMFFISVAQKPI